MIKHTTLPRKVHAAMKMEEFGHHTNVCGGNRNKHAQRRIPSSMRTRGRIKRWMRRVGASENTTSVEYVYNRWRTSRKQGGPFSRRRLIEAYDAYASSKVALDAALQKAHIKPIGALDDDEENHCRHEWNQTAGEADESGTRIYCLLCGQDGDA